MLPTPPRFARLALGLGLLIGLVGSAPVRAADITFDLSSGVNGQSTVTKTVSGYTMTLTPIGTSSTFYGDNNGLLIGPFDFDVHTGFQIQVTGGSLSFLNYTVGDTSLPSANPFDLSGGTGTSTNNTLASTGVKNYNGSYSITPGQTVTLTPGSTSGQSTIKFMTFSTAVPEPSTYALGLVATGVLAAVARRRRATRA